MGFPDDEIVTPENVPDDLACAVCLETFLDPVHSPDSPCRHSYCRQCIFDTLRLVRAECPTCRRPSAQIRGLAVRTGGTWAIAVRRVFVIINSVQFG